MGAGGGGDTCKAGYLLMIGCNVKAFLWHPSAFAATVVKPSLTPFTSSPTDQKYNFYANGSGIRVRHSGLCYVLDICKQDLERRSKGNTQEWLF